jgi:hypothetical protein
MGMVTQGPPPYPLKFPKGLGKDLDGWAKAKKPTDKDKFKGNALVTITDYRNKIKAVKVGDKNWKDKLSAQLLLTELQKIQDELDK